MTTKDFYSFVKWQVKEGDAYVDITANTFVNEDTVLKAVWEKRVVTASSISDLIAYAEQYVYIQLEDDIAVEAGYYNDSSTPNVDNAVIRTLNARIDGNGHTITLTAEGKSYRIGMGFIDTISETGEIRNVIMKGVYGASGPVEGAAYCNACGKEL